MGSLGGQERVCNCRSLASLDTDNETKSIRINVYIKKGEKAGLDRGRSESVVQACKTSVN